MKRLSASVCCLWAVLLIAGGAGPGYGQENLPADHHISYTFPNELSLCGEKVPLEVPQVWESLDREFTIAVYNRGQVMLWLKRICRCFPYIEKELQELGMPDDIKYLAVAESSLMTYIFSSKGAGGPWQFIRPTARKYGLRQGGYFDDRLNFEKSTEAALAYLMELYQRFGSWTLAMAAYNCGEFRVEKEMKEQGENDYYRLNLPVETERYIFRILARKIILSDPHKYGFYLPDQECYQPREVDLLEVDFPGPLHMRTLARACGSYLKAVKELNPEVRGYYFPKGKYQIRLPKGSKVHFVKFYNDWIKKVQRTNYEVHVVRRGDTLQEIANRYGVRVNSLKKWNGITGYIIHPGQKIKIY